MITITSTPDDPVFTVRISGKVTDEDYKTVLIPALEAALVARERVRILAVVEKDFQGYTLPAMAEDARLGMKHWRGFDRAAVVTDTGWLKTAVKGFSVFMPCPVMTFPLSQEEDARRWLTESLGAMHQIDLGNGALQVRLLGKLDAAAYEQESADLDAFLEKHGHFRLLLDLREFDGWQGFDGLGEHLQLVRGHYHKLDRIGIVGDAAWQGMAARFGRHLLGVTARYFPAEKFNEARDWVVASG